MPQDRSERTGCGGEHGGHPAALFIAVAGELGGENSGHEWTRPDPAISGQVTDNNFLTFLSSFNILCCRVGMYVCMYVLCMYYVSFMYF